MQQSFTKPILKAGCICLMVLLCSGGLILSSKAQTIAFPGAEGAGRMAEGGRYGEVYIVNNLNDSGPGSFRDAVSEPNRIVVFEVGGIIHLSSRIIVSNNITIAGQTAPGDGVVIYGDGITFTQASNTIVRYLRVRMGRYGTSGADAMTMTDDAKNLIFDHVSASWGRDETFSITGHADSITIQNSIISQGLETHSCGGLLEPSGLISLFRNLYIDNNTRNPKVKNRNQFVNNVVYNWGRGGGYIMGGSTADSRVNIVNNYYIDGPSTTIRPFSRGTETFIPYVEGNYHDGNLNGTLDGELVPLSAYEGITTFADVPYDYPFPDDVMTAQESYDFVLEHVGANYPVRDQVDEFLTTELTSLGLEGKLISNERELPMGGPGQLFGAPAPSDGDRDGIPDDWEAANGLDPNDPSDAMQIASDGYANIEHYINGLPDQAPAEYLKPITDISASDITSSSMALSWTNNDSSYEGIILSVTAQEGDVTFLDSLGGNVTQYEVTDLEPNTSYQFELRPYQADLEAISAVSSAFKTIPVPSAPSEPVNGYPVDEGSFTDTTFVQLTWSGSENTDYYVLYAGEDEDNLLLLDSLETTAYEWSGLQSDTDYYWRVDAGNELGLTEGQVWSFTTRPYIPRGLVGAWLMDASEGTLVGDSTDFANDGEVNELNDYSWITGKVNNALDMTNAENPSHVFIPHADQLYFDTHSFAISMWLKSTDGSSQSYLIHKGTFSANESTGGTGQWYGIEIKDGDLRFAIDDNHDKTQLSTSASPIFTGEWVHLVAMRDTEEDVLRLYINGEEIKEVGDGTDLSIGQEEPIILGNSNGFGTPFRGNIDEVRLYNKSLSAQEVLELYHTLPTPMKAFSPSLGEGGVLEGFGDTVQVSWNGGINTTGYEVYLGTHPDSLILQGTVPVETPQYEIEGLQGQTTYFWRVDAIGAKGTTKGDIWSFQAAAPAGLVGYWKMDEASGTLVEDYSKYGKDGQSQGFQSTERVLGKFGQAYLFDEPSATASVDIAHEDHLLFDEVSFTISMWIKIAEDTYRYGDGKDCYLIHKGSFADNWYGIQLRDGRLTFGIDDDRTKTTVSTSVGNGSSHPIFTDEWVHLVAIRDKDDSEIRFYINGEKTAETGYSTGKIGKASPVRLGNSDENKPYRDLMDDVRLYNYVLDEAEIAALYHAFPKLEVHYKNGDASSPANNQIKPYLKLVNMDTMAVDLGNITARYWLTAEQMNDIQTRIDYASLGNEQVSMDYIMLDEPREGAFGYVEYGFAEGNVIALDGNSGEIKSAIHDDDWSVMDETNDYSMSPASTYIVHDKITLYADDNLIWGKEPQPVSVEQDAAVMAKNDSSNDNTIKKAFNLKNTGNVPLDYEGISIRYWFTKDGGGALKFWKDYAALGKENLHGAFMALGAPTATADHYVEITFDASLGQLAPLSETEEIKVRITKTDWTDFEQENDYSNHSESGWVLQEQIAVFYYGKLMFGMEPDSENAAATAALRTNLTNEESSARVDQTAELATIKVYPNPTQGKLQLEVGASAEEPVEVSIYDANGVLMVNRTLEESTSNWDISSYASGIYFVYINQSGLRTVYKVIKE
ncbi:T9SS type A sorting domain-containing protein [Echinicola soli]|uniref:T9SS type A sorting domain-containing protein n=1 Tax=Echinicola soli TaxID=2591634 RepID=A0A514CL44_9BACT|nr:LamG-like jellyroll fold domain-containing protein [Echinicola soli]QDH80543.1 T9SS type A sorting domain-containing protein [Echinicola soli]